MSDPLDALDFTPDLGNVMPDDVMLGPAPPPKLPPSPEVRDAAYVARARLHGCDCTIEVVEGKIVHTASCGLTRLWPSV